MELSREYLLLKVVFLDVLEIAVSIHFQFSYCQFIAYNDAVLVRLEGGQCACVAV